jgi:peptide-methionine (S)-S-oxide reductase
MMKEETAVFAGGCFWCVEPLFDRLEGVISVSSGYAGGTFINPSYEEVCQGNTGHLEVVKVVFDPTRISYAKLLDIFWHHIDPTDPIGQFCDKGPQYLSAIFYTSEEQRELAESTKSQVSAFLRGHKVYTQIRPLTHFYPAEDYHQDFHNKNPGRYQAYRSCCGRDQRLKELWG